MVIKSGLIVILQMCIILMGKLLKWLLMVVYVCGVTEIIMFHYLLLFIRLLLWLAEGDGQQMVTDHDKSVNTEPNCVDDNNQGDKNNAVNMAQGTVSGNNNDEVDNSLQCSSDTDDIADDDNELQQPVSESSDSGEEQVLVIASAVLNVTLEQSVECTETSSPQELVLTVDKITEEWRKQALQEKPVESTGLVTEVNSGSEDEDSEADCLDYLEREEQFKVYGAVPKSDDSGTTEAIMTIGQHHSVIMGDDRFASQAEPPKEAAIQKHAGEEVNDGGTQQATSTSSTSVGTVTHTNHGKYTTPNN